MPNFITKF